MFDDPWLMLSGMFIGMVGLGYFIYGKKQEDLKCLAGGMVLSVFPYFVHSVGLMWLVAAGCMAAVHAWRRMG